MATLRHLPTTYEECKEFLGSRGSRECGYSTSVEESTFCVDSITFTRYSIRHFRTQIAFFYPDGSIQMFSGGYKSKTTVMRMNRVLEHSWWCIYRKNNELGWHNVTQGFNYPFHEGDRVYIHDNPYVDIKAIYGDIREMGLNYMVALNLLRM